MARRDEIKANIAGRPNRTPAEERAFGEKTPAEKRRERKEIQEKRRNKPRAPKLGGREINNWGAPVRDA